MMRFDRSTERAQESALRAAEIIHRYGHNQIDTEHLLLALLEQPDGTVTKLFELIDIKVESVIERLDATLRASPKVNIFGGGAGQIYITPRTKRIVELAGEEAERIKDEYISTEHLFLAILAEKKTPAARILENVGVTRDKIGNAIEKIRGDHRISNRYQSLCRYSRELTRLARESSLDPVVERDKEILQIIQIILQRKSNNPLIVGKSGIGKTALVYGVSQRIADGDVPQMMLKKEIWILDYHALMAGVKYCGEMEERVYGLVEDTRRRNAILFLDDLHELLNKEWKTFFDVLLSKVVQGDIQIICSISVEGYEKYIKTDTFLSQLFSPILLGELSAGQTIVALKALRRIYEIHHQIAISDDAIDFAVRLSDRFIKDRYQPDKSVHIVDQAAASLHLLRSELSTELQSDQIRIEKLRDEEQNAFDSNDSHRAADIKEKREELEKALEININKWHKENSIPDQITRKEVINIILRETGLTIEQLTT